MKYLGMSREITPFSANARWQIACTTLYARLHSINYDCYSSSLVSCPYDGNSATEACVTLQCTHMPCTYATLQQSLLLVCSCPTMMLDVNRRWWALSRRTSNSAAQRGQVARLIFAANAWHSLKTSSMSTHCVSSTTSLQSTESCTGYLVHTVIVSHKHWLYAGTRSTLSVGVSMVCFDLVVFVLHMFTHASRLCRAVCTCSSDYPTRQRTSYMSELNSCVCAFILLPARTHC
jgi:hypothetical protein